MIEWICSPDVLLTFAAEVLLGTGFEDTAIEPMAYDVRGANTPVRPAPMTVIFGRTRWRCGGGSVGEITRSRTYCKIWYRKRTGCVMKYWRQLSKYPIAASGNDDVRDTRGKMKVIFF
jgi:hypothetical protein